MFIPDLMPISYPIDCICVFMVIMNTENNDHRELHGMEESFIWGEFSQQNPKLWPDNKSNFQILSVGVLSSEKDVIGT